MQQQETNVFTMHQFARYYQTQHSALLTCIYVTKSSYLSFFYFTYEMQVQPNSTTKVMIQNDSVLVFDLICKNPPSSTTYLTESPDYRLPKIQYKLGQKQT